MELYIIRHAQSTNNLLYATTGNGIGRSTDPELTPTGIKQAEVVGEYLAHRPAETNGNYAAWIQNHEGFGLTHLYCSLMIRSIETGLAISRATGVPLHVWADWHETGGIFEENPFTHERTGIAGKTPAELATAYPDVHLSADLDPAGWWNRPYEDIPEQHTRALRVLTTLLDRHADQDHRVAVVSHGGFHNRFLRALLHLDDESETWFSLVNTGITRIDFRGDTRFITYLNRASHLPPELLTY